MFIDRRGWLVRVTVWREMLCCCPNSCGRRDKHGSRPAVTLHVIGHDGQFAKSPSGLFGRGREKRSTLLKWDAFDRCNQGVCLVGKTLCLVKSENDWLFPTSHWLVAGSADFFCLKRVFFFSSCSFYGCRVQCSVDERNMLAHVLSYGSFRWLKLKMVERERGRTRVGHESETTRERLKW